MSFDVILQEYSKRKKEIQSRLEEFKKIKGNDIFYELCFCILTPQSSGFRADECIRELKKLDFLNKNINPKPILKKKIRFHNNKTKYLLSMKKNFPELKFKIENNPSKKLLQLSLLNNVKGIGRKEVNHFLRNIGYENLAILDRHILKNLKKHNAIKEIPKSLTDKKYREIGNKFQEFSQKVKIPMDHLDLLF